MPRSRRLALSALAVLAVAASALVSFRWCYDPDLWWHLAQGREIAAGRLPRTNLFSFTHPDFPQPSTSWLFDLGTYGLWHIGGAAAVQLGQAAALVVSLALLFAACRQRAGIAASAAVVAFGFFVLEPRALPRPHTLSFAGMAASALLIERARARRSVWPLVWAVPLFAVWSNLHVESLFGLAYLGCFAAGMVLESDAAARALGWRALLVTAACAAATTINPYGLGPVQYLLDNARVPEVIRIAELQPPYLPNYATFYVYLLRSASCWRRPVPVPGCSRPGSSPPRRALRFLPVICATAAVARPRCAVGRPAPPLGAVLLGLLGAHRAGDVRTSARRRRSPRAGRDHSARRPFAARVDLRGPVFDSNNIGGWVIWDGCGDARVPGQQTAGGCRRNTSRHHGASRSPGALERARCGVDWAILSVPRASSSGRGTISGERVGQHLLRRCRRVLVRRHGAFMGT
jgi:hypothetical protein